MKHGIGAALGAALSVFGFGTPSAYAADPTLTTEQSKMLQVLEGAAKHVLTNGDHVPVAAFVMRPSGAIELVDLGQPEGYAHQEDALQFTLERLVLMVRTSQVKASGIMFQPEDATQPKSNQMLFDVEQRGQPRYLVSFTYVRRNGEVSFGQRKYTKLSPKLLAPPAR